MFFSTTQGARKVRSQPYRPEVSLITKDSYREMPLAPDFPISNHSGFGNCCKVGKSGSRLSLKVLGASSNDEAVTHRVNVRREDCSHTQGTG